MILRSMRNGFFSVIFLGLLVLGGVSLVFTDWNGMFKGGINKTDIATIDGTPIKIAEFNGRLNQILRRQQIDVATAYQMGLVDNILRQEIFEIMLKKNAAELGIRVPDRIIAEQVKDMISPLKTDGISDKEALKKFLEMQGLSEGQLITALRDDLTTKILKSTISSGAYIPAALTNDILHYKNISRTVDVVFLPNSAISIKDKPTDAELEKFYQGISNNYMIPEHRDVTIAVLDTSKIGKPKITDSDIKAVYNDNQDDYMSPENADVEQALFSDEAKAKTVADAVKSGKSMSDTVKTVMGDTKSYQGKNNFSKDGLPADIATPVFAAKAGDVIGPVKSPLGFHVIKVAGITAAKAASFDSVKEKIRKELEDEKSGDAVFNVTSQIEDRLAGGETFESMKDEFPLSISTVKNLAQGMTAPKEMEFAGKNSADVLAKAFAVTQDAPSELKEATSTLLYSIRLDKLSPAAPKPFADVKDSVMKKWIAANQAQENMLSAQKKVDDINAGKAKLSSLKPFTISALTRSGSDKIAKDATERFMSADKGKSIMVISKEKDGIYIGEVKSVTLPTMKDTKESDIKPQLEADLASATYMGYLASLQNKYDVSVNDGLLKRVYGTPKDEQ